MRNDLKCQLNLSDVHFNQPQSTPIKLQDLFVVKETQAYCKAVLNSMCDLIYDVI